jgi:hypothetical protein
MQRKKQIEKKLNTFEVMVEKPILNNPPWASGAILWKNSKISSIIFSHFQHEHNAKNRLKKFSLKKKLQSIEI